MSYDEIGSQGRSELQAMVSFRASPVDLHLARALAARCGTSVSGWFRGLVRSEAQDKLPELVGEAPRSLAQDR